MIKESNDSDETKSSIMKQAEQILQSAENKFPTFNKIMFHSNVKSITKI